MPSQHEISGTWRIGVDVGGTFTDLVLVDSTGSTLVAKVPSVPEDPSLGVVNAVEAIANRTQRPVTELLRGCVLFVHGSTVATNTMLEGTGAKVGLVTTEGFRDALEIRRGIREDQWDHRSPYAPVMVPRFLRKGVRGRIDADGHQIEPLDAQGVADAAELFKDEGVESIAVALFNSFLDPLHEDHTANLLEQTNNSKWRTKDECWITTSTAVSPLMGEYERTSTAVVNAALAPRTVSYLRKLDLELGRLGLKHGVLMVQSNGGVASVASVESRPVNLLLSGPAAAVGALDRYRSIRASQGITGSGNLLSMEIGGTSCDVMLMSEGKVEVKGSLDIAGYHVSTPAVDVHTVGAGGGTIAGVDNVGGLFVGPEGAGADPGPACYGLGGTKPTITDAQLVLGRLRPGPYADDSLTLCLQPARDAIASEVAEPLGITVEEAAVGMVTVLEQNLLGAVEYLSIERGHSPEAFTLVAAGGAGPMHGDSVARGLGCSEVYIPREAGALCAIGMLNSNIRQDVVRHLSGSIDELDMDDLSSTLMDLEAEALALVESEGFNPDEISLQVQVDLHHPGQLWSIKVEVDPRKGSLDPKAIRTDFEREYERLYGHVQDGGTILLASGTVVATASPGEWADSKVEPSDQMPEPVEVREVWHEGIGWAATPVFDGATLRPGVALQGPLLVEETTTTVVVGANSSLGLDTAGNYVLNIDRSINSGGMPVEAPTESVGLTLLQNRLDQITRHMGWVMTRTARSTIFSQSHDFSCFITDAEGTLVANADGIPIHTSGGGFAVRALRERWQNEIYPDDVFLLSDPYVAGGNHLPDWVIARPVFASGNDDDDPTLLGFCCNRAHQSDIGGGLAGTYNPEATEIWQEGIRLPVMKLFDRGIVRSDLWELLCINCRTPELLDGDLLAMVGSTQIGAERVVAVAAEHGHDAYFRRLSGVLDHAEQHMRRAISELPDGTYHGADLNDNDCFGPLDTWIRATVTVSGEEITVDFSDSDPQMRGFKNSSLANTYSAVYLALSSFFDPSIPRNEGTYRPCCIIAPEGTIVNALPPAPMTMNTVFVAHEIVHAVWKALGIAEPARSLAGWSKTMHGHVTGTEDAKTWVMYHWHAMGTPGATRERDGFNQLGHLISLGGLDIANLEFHEQNFPVRYRRWEFRTDAAGAGLNRGGSGVIYEAEVLKPATWSFRAEGLGTVSGFGAHGGSDGAPGEEWVVPDHSDEELFVPPKYGVRRLGPATMVALTPGGGGWGDPFQREPERVLRDVRDEVISPEMALVLYGVALSAEGTEIDWDETHNQRRSLGGAHNT